MTKKESAVDRDLEAMDSVLTTSEQYLEKNYKRMLIGVGALVLVAVAGFGLYHGVFVPREQEAANALVAGQNYLAVDSFEVALKGNGEYLGFEKIADEYGMTKSANLASAYAGICYYKMGQTEEALAAFKSFSFNDDYVAPAVIGRIGDCYADMGKLDEAADCFEQAGKESASVLAPVYLKKAGLAYEALGNKEAAVKCYEAIKANYPTSQEASDIEKYIERI